MNKYIIYQGEEYKCRVLIDNDGEELIIGSTELLDILSPFPMTDNNSGFADKEAEEVYDQIFYFVDKSDLALPDEELKAIVAEANPDWFD